MNVETTNMCKHSCLSDLWVQNVACFFQVLIGTIYFNLCKQWRALSQMSAVSLRAENVEKHSRLLKILRPFRYILPSFKGCNIQVSLDVLYVFFALNYKWRGERFLIGEHLHR